MVGKKKKAKKKLKLNKETLRALSEKEAQQVQGGFDWHESVEITAHVITDKATGPACTLGITLIFEGPNITSPGPTLVSQSPSGPTGSGGVCKVTSNSGWGPNGPGTGLGCTIAGC